MTWLDTVLSQFLHTVDDGFRHFWTNAKRLLADSFFQLGNNLRILIIYSFLQANPEKKIEIWKFIAQKWHAQNKIHYFCYQWTYFKNKGRVRNLRKENISRDTSSNDTVQLITLREWLKTWTTGLEENLTVWHFCVTDFRENWLFVFECWMVG